MRGIRAVTAVQQLAEAAADHRFFAARWPGLDEVFAGDAALPRRDPWHREFVFEQTADGLGIVRCAGADGRFGTGDDIVSWPIDGSGRFCEGGAPAPVTSR